jgi:hypothetical protein
MLIPQTLAFAYYQLSWLLYDERVHKQESLAAVKQAGFA